MDNTPEPSVLDYVKSLLTPWKGPRIELPPLPGDQPASPTAKDEAKVFASLDSASNVGQAVNRPSQVDRLPGDAEEAVNQPSLVARFPGEAASTRPGLFSTLSMIPWRSMLALWLALVAQVVLQPRPDPERWKGGLLFYLVSFALLAWAMWKDEWELPTLQVRELSADPGTARLAPLIVAIVLIPIAFLAFGGNKFNAMNLLLWLLCLAATMYAFWVRGTSPSATIERWLQDLKAPEWRLRITRWGLLILVIFAVAAFFRIYQINQVPSEMNSDHAEKLLDVYDVLNGEYRIFFPRNTGREGLQFYLGALVARLFSTGISFMSLKIGTVLAGLLTLPYIYLLAREFGGRRAAALALLLAAVAAWPNILSRIALRFSLYPLFVAPVLYHLLRGLRTGSRNHFILAGVFLGIGLHGYTPMRIVPLVILVAVGLYFLHTRDTAQRKRALLGLGVLVAVSFVIFLPLLRFAQENPNEFAYRAFTRILDWEQPLPSQLSSLTGVFISNVWKAFIMMAWNSGDIWLVTVTNHPALDVVSAALFYLGFAGLLVSYFRTRRWEHLFLAISVPLLMLPSSLSLAFPGENPAPNRMGGSLVPVFVIAGLAFSSFVGSIYRKARSQQAASKNQHLSPALVTGLLLLVVFSQNYDLVFKQYARSYSLSSWNTSEVGRVIGDYIDTIGEPDTAWVVAIPHWMDTRLVGMVAGQPTRDYAVFPENIPGVAASDSRPKLYIVRADDVQDLQTLQQLYPEYVMKEYQSAYENKNFILFYATGPSTNFPGSVNPAGRTNP